MLSRESGDILHAATSLGLSTICFVVRVHLEVPEVSACSHAVMIGAWRWNCGGPHRGCFNPGHHCKGPSLNTFNVLIWLLFDLFYLFFKFIE